MVDILIIALVSAILGGILYFLLRQKKRGVQCIGCPDAPKCSGSCASCPGCESK